MMPITFCIPVHIYLKVFGATEQREGVSAMLSLAGYFPAFCLPHCRFFPFSLVHCAPDGHSYVSLGLHTDPDA